MYPTINHCLDLFEMFSSRTMSAVSETIVQARGMPPQCEVPITAIRKNKKPSFIQNSSIEEQLLDKDLPHLYNLVTDGHKVQDLQFFIYINISPLPVLRS